MQREKEGDVCEYMAKHKLESVEKNSRVIVLSLAVKNEPLAGFRFPL